MKKYPTIFYSLVVFSASIFLTGFVANSQTQQQQTEKRYSMGTNVPAADLTKIESALPQSAFVKPKKPRTLLIFDLNVNYGGHLSAAYANVAFKMMGEKTGAFKTVISSDPSVFEKESLKSYDAVFFNNNVGNLFTNRDLRENLAEFVYGGGGLMGVHGTTVAFTKWPGAIEDWEEFGIMLGARGANHRENTELITVKIDDPTHPLNKIFGGKSFEYRDEFFRYQTVYSRDKLRVLLSIDTNKLDLAPAKSYGNTIRKDHDYAIAWVRSYGRGRVFHSTIAHNTYVFQDPMMLKFYLGAVQFVLGDLDAPTTPSGKLNSFTKALENLNWHAGARLAFSENISIEEFAEMAHDNNVYEICVPYGINIFRNNDFKFKSNLPDSQKERFRLMLDKFCVRMTTCELSDSDVGIGGLNSVFEFLKIMGVESVVIPYNKANIRQLAEIGRQNDIQIIVNPPADSDFTVLNDIDLNSGGDVGLLAVLNSKESINGLTTALKPEKSNVSAVLLSRNVAGNITEIEKLFGRIKENGVRNFRIWLNCDKKDAQTVPDLMNVVSNVVVRIQ